MAFVKVLSLAQLPPDSAVEVMIDASPIALCHVGGEVRALEGVCPHQGGPLGHGTIAGDNVACPWHGWEFNCATGRNDFDPETRLRTYSVKIENGDILVDVENA
jgi:nitrite reductase/ring-hydroxylating ferredoxin subunit